MKDPNGMSRNSNQEWRKFQNDKELNKHLSANRADVYREHLHGRVSQEV